MASQRSNLLPLVAFLGLFVCACSQPASDKTTPAGQALIGSYNIAGCTPGGEGCGGGIQALIDFGADFTEMLDYDGKFEIVEEAAPGLLLVRWTYPGDPAPFIDEGVYNLIPCDLSQAPEKPYDKMCLTGAWAAQSYPDECGTETTPACEHNTTTASSFWGTQFAAIFLDADERPLLKSSWAEVSQNMGENPTGTGMEVAVHESLSVTDCDCL